ncbi:MAG: hypothetical protein P8Z81_14800 [Deinococcales bacterium]
MRKVKFLILATVLAMIAGAAFAAGPAYYVQAETVRGSQNPTGPSCVLTSTFKTGEQIVFLAKVYSTATGDVVTPDQAKQLGMKVTAKLEDGKTIDLELGQHPHSGEPKVWMWANAFVIPPVYPTGVFKYSLIVTDNQGNTVTWTPMNQDYPTAEGYPTLITIEKR